MATPIAVLGGGNGGHMMAADLALGGHDVNLCELPQFKDGFQATLDKGEIEITGIRRQGVARLHMATLDMEKAIRDVDLINIVVPAEGQDPFFEEMIPFLRGGQIVVVWAGRFGSLRLRRMLTEKGVGKAVSVAEVNTLPYGTRLLGPAHVHQFLAGSRISVSALPAGDTARVVARLSEMYPALPILPAQNVLEAAFNNAALSIFPCGSILNTGRIQYSEGEFYMFKEGVTEAVARCIRATYDEMFEISRAFGFSMLTYEDRDFRRRSSIEGTELVAPFDTDSEFAKVRGPTSVPHRYFVENIGYGLVPISELASKAGVSAPLIEALITIGSVVCNNDFRRTGRSLETLGLARMTKQEIVRFLETGVYD